MHDASLHGNIDMIDVVQRNHDTLADKPDYGSITDTTEDTGEHAPFHIVARFNRITCSRKALRAYAKK